MILCVTIEIANGQFASVLNERVVNVSRHRDYSLFHWKAYDVKALKTSIDKFVFLDITGAVSECIEAPQLKRRGVNFQTAERSSIELNDEEMIHIARAMELVEAHSQPIAASKTEGAGNMQPADDGQSETATESTSQGKASDHNGDDRQEDESDTASTEGEEQPDSGTPKKSKKTRRR